MVNILKNLTWKGYAALCGVAAAAVVWSVILYFELVKQGILHSPWTI